ncbi:MAG: WD40 repeat domain-containing protein [Myxococcota bacterium]
MRAAIVDPLHLVGATVPDELVEELITLAEPESFRLSKLAVVLRALWADAVKRDAMRPALSMADLQALRAVQARPADVLEEPYEGLRNVFSRVMDRSLEGLSASELEAARDMLIHVVRPGRANEDMRCMKPRGEVVHATDHLASPKARRVLEKLAGPAEDRRPTGLEPFRVIESLNTSGDAESLDLRHDVLLTDWRILAVWLEEARDILERRDELMLLETKTDPFDDKTLSDATCVRLLGEDLDRVSRARYEGVLDERARQFLGELQARRPTPIARRVPRWVAAAALLLLGIFVGGSIWLVDYLDRLDDDNRMAAVRIAGNDEASHATRILLSGVRRPQRQEAWSDDVVASLERPAVRRSLVGPCSEILDLDASADGAMIAAGCADGRVAWWSIDNPSVAGVLDAHSLAVRSVAMAADGTWLVSSSHDGDALIVPLDGESEPRRLEGNGQPLTNIAADPRGRLVIAGSHDGTAKVWKVEDGELLGELAGHRGWVQLVEVSPDGRRVLTVAKDGKARVWTLPGRYLELPTQTAVLDHGGQWIPAAHFSPDGARILTGAVSGEVRIWTFDEEGEPVAEVLGRHDRGIVSAHFDRTGTRVVSTGGDERVQIWPLTAEGSRATLELDGAAPVSAAFAPSGDDVLVAVEGGEVWRWTPGEDDDFVRYTSGRTELRDLVVRSEPAQLVTGTADGVARVWDLDQRLVPEAVTPDVSIASAWFGGEEDNRLVAALAEGGARIFDRTTGQLTGAIIEGQLDGAGIAPGASRVATILNGRVRIWSTEELAAPQTVGPSDVEVSRVAFGPDGEVLAALGGDGVLRIYVAASGREVRTIRLRRENIVTFAFDPRGRVVTGGSTGSVDVWKVEGGIAIKSFEGLPGEVLAVAMGEERVVAGGDRVATVWSLQDPEFRADLAGHQGAVREVSITEDGAYVLTVSDDRVARLWEVKRPDSPLGRSEEGCSAFQAALLADDDGPRVAVACRNGPAELWKPNGAAMRLSREGTSVSQVTFSPDGAELLTASDEGPVAIWPASVDRLRGALLDGVEPCLTPGERARFLGEDPETAAARWRGCARACWDRTFPEDQPVERFTCPTKPR